MGNLSANVYGIGSSRKDSNPTISANLGVTKSERSSIGKGGPCTRFIGADAANGLVYAEIWVRNSVTMAANETFTLTVKAG